MADFCKECSMETIWESTVDDGMFKCAVTRTGKRTGMLTVEDTTQNKTLLEQAVSLSYGAIFGPDIDDVRHWQELCINIIDGVQT